MKNHLQRVGKDIKINDRTKPQYAQANKNTKYQIIEKKSY